MSGKEVVFNVTACHKTGGYVAQWNDIPGHGGITTEGETLSELEEMIADAVAGYFELSDRPQKVKLHFVEDPVLAL
jgi:predicted RNase H-like HicB family nuclease